MCALLVLTASLCFKCSTTRHSGGDAAATLKSSQWRGIADQLYASRNRTAVCQLIMEASRGSLQLIHHNVK